MPEDRHEDNQDQETQTHPMRESHRRNFGRAADKQPRRRHHQALPQPRASLHSDRGDQPQRVRRHHGENGAAQQQ